MVLLTYACFGALGITSLVAGGKVFKHVYYPFVRKPIHSPPPFEELVKTAKLSQLAYSNGLTNTCFDMLPTFVDGNPTADAQAYMWEPNSVSNKDDICYVAFRGTSSCSDVLTDLDVRMYHVKGLGSGDVLVHQGFYNQYCAIKNKLWKALLGKTHIVFCGHSLGAALATIAATEYAIENPSAAVECYTIGSPRVGNRAFRDLFKSHVSSSFRVYNENDPVSMVPLSGRYEHVGLALEMNDAGGIWQRSCDDPWYLRPLVCGGNIDPAGLVKDHDCDLYIARLLDATQMKKEK